ncbi:MAG: DUF1501 domain-containing protein [Planctomycetia bacterium]|nr:DUF1501 domain-containing protein [Planctomycetia bacterium]
MSSQLLRRACPEFRQWTRRDLLHTGLLGTVGLTLPNLLRLESRAVAAGTSVDHGKSVILLWMRGGPSQHDMWDPKPEAPAEIRGEFRPIPTSVPGIQLTELLLLSARLMDRWSIIRSLAHRPEDGNVGHSTGDQICFTGYPHAGNPDLNTMPSCAAYVVKQKQHLDPVLPVSVVIPRHVPGTGAAWLGRGCDPFETVADPATDSSFRIPNLLRNHAISAPQQDERRRLLESVDRLDLGETGQVLTRYQAQALEILQSDRCRVAFDLEREPAALRERYGLMPAFSPNDPERCGAPNWAQRMLLARRLVEAGVRLVTVDLRWWDFHKEGFDSQRRGFLPRWDRAFSALIEDLEQRGLLASTLVVAWGEIGRTPHVNKQAGRDHWPYVMSAAVAGGGTQGGRVVGSSDARGAYPKDNRKFPHDVLATIYRHLGIDTQVNYTDPRGRPHPVLPQGTAIEDLF